MAYGTDNIDRRAYWMDPSMQTLQDIVTELRPTYSHLYDDMSEGRYLNGEIVQCGLWFPATKFL